MSLGSQQAALRTEHCILMRILATSSCGGAGKVSGRWEPSGTYTPLKICIQELYTNGHHDGCYLSSWNVPGACVKETNREKNTQLNFKKDLKPLLIKQRHSHLYTKSIVWLVVLFEVRLYAVQALDVYKVLKGALLLKGLYSWASVELC